jgi:TatD DNase family protein
MLVDSHCHLDFPDYAGKMAEIQAEMQARQVTHALCISVNLDGFPNVLRLAEENANFYATVGVHPDQLPDALGAAASVEDLLERSRHPKIVAIGETGLDYHWIKGDAEWQRERFRVHIRAARLAGKPLVVHTREAAADTLRIMREEGAEQVGGVMHCFTETLETALAALEMNFLISFSGIVTFKSAADLREVARALPLDRLLVETDSPFLAPIPHRGKTNQPAWVRHVAEEISRLKGVPLETVAEATTANFERLFGLTLNAQPIAVPEAQ